MTSPHSQTPLLSICCMLVVVSTAGCLGVSGVSNSDAKERALAAEEQHITKQLENASCVENWSLVSFVGLEKEASITNRTDEGVHVVVKHPYSYSTEQDEADHESEAHYLVSPDDVDRISGTKVSPC